MHPSSGVRALTLIELLVVMAIISMLAGLVVAFMPRDTRRTRAKMEIERLKMALDEYSDTFRALPPDTGYGLPIEAGSPYYDPGSLYRYLCQPQVDPRTGTVHLPLLDSWPAADRLSFEDPLRGAGEILLDPWGHPYGFTGDRRRVRFNVGSSDIFSAGPDGQSAGIGYEGLRLIREDEENRAYNGADDDGNGIVDDAAELGPNASRFGEDGDDIANYEPRE